MQVNWSEHIINTYVAVGTVLPAAARMIGFSRVRTRPTRRVNCITRRSYTDAKQTHNNHSTITQNTSAIYIPLTMH